MAFDFWTVALVTVFLIGLSKSGFASGFEGLGVPLFALYVSPGLAAGILLPILILVDATNLWTYRRLWDWSLLRLLIPGAVLGILIGALCISYVNVDGIRLMVGAIALWFGGLYWLRPLLPPLWRGGPMGGGAGFALATVSGFTSHIAHAGGPPMRAFLLSRDLDKGPFMGTNSVYFQLVNLIKLIPYLMSGQITAQSFVLSVKLVPAVLLGVLAGVILHRRVSQQTFTRIAYVFLVLVGFKLVWDALPALI